MTEISGMKIYDHEDVWWRGRVGNIVKVKEKGAVWSWVYFTGEWRGRKVYGKSIDGSIPFVWCEGDRYGVENAG